jgi:AraC family transcriptional regulator of adaptative response/methylated-DNA-[protein]-cysteine methyltransferase
VVEFDAHFSVDRVGRGNETPGMNTPQLPTEPVMLEAFLTRDPSFDGVFLTGVRTTGIFCRTTCPARKPRPENVSFFADAQAALLAGFRPCRRCRPLEPLGTPPTWLRPLLEEVDADPTRRWTDGDLRGAGMSPERVRRWFKTHHGMTFQAYSRARRLGAALGRVNEGGSVAGSAYAVGYESLSGFQEAFRRYFGEPPTQAEGAELAWVDRITTPLGPMLAAATDEALVLLEFADRRALPRQVERVRHRLGVAFTPGRNPVIERAAKELEAYFAGRLERFTVPIRPCGTEFQRAVWAELAAIPAGETRSYSDLASAVGRPGAVRAVGSANGANAIAIVIPCHRVVGSDGRLKGYGGGVWRKQRLLDVESEGRRI